MGAIYKAGGEKHYNGGTKIKAQQGAYIVSDYVKTDPAVLQALGFDPKTDNKKTWAALLQSKVDPRYYNSMAGIIADQDKGKDVDRYAYNAARLKMPALQSIISRVALGNELSKAIQGKPYAIPQIAMNAVNALQPGAGQQGVAPPEDHPMAEAQMGGLMQLQDGNQFDPWAGDKHDNTKNASLYTKDQIYQKANALGFKGPYNNLSFQRWLLQNPTLRPTIDTLHTKYGMPNAGIADDGKWGYRWDMIVDKALENPVEKKIVPAPEKPKETFVVPRRASDTPVFDNSTREVKLRPNAFDQIALLNAATTPINTYYPWAARPQAAYVDSQFDEPNYYPIQALQRQRMDMLNQTANPSVARAVGSYQPDQIMGIIQETQRARGNNMQAAANAKAFNAQTFNTLSAQNAQIDTGLYDKTIMTKEQRDIARKLKAQDVQNTAHSMINNLIQMKYQLAQNPQMAVSGPFWENVGFNGNGRGLDGSGGWSNAGAAPEMTREQFMAKYPGYAALDGDPQQAYKIDEAFRDERNRLLKNRNFAASTYNPYMTQMTGMGAAYPQGGE
jgi:hypothetical protein